MKPSKKPSRHPRHPAKEKHPRNTLATPSKIPSKKPLETPLEDWRMRSKSARVDNLGVTIDTKKPATTNAVTGYRDVDSFDSWMRTIVGWMLIAGLVVLAWMALESPGWWHVVG